MFFMIIVLTILLFAAMTPVSAPTHSKFAPPMGNTLLIVGQDIPSISEYDHHVGGNPAGYSVYTSLQSLEGLATPSDTGGGLQHAQWVADTHPYAALQLGLHMVGTLQSVMNGAMDAHIDRLADWISATHRPVYLRPGYEFDYPENHYDPALYVGAFRRIVDRFRAKRVENVAFVWHSFAQPMSGKIEDWYPGDSYADWVAVSYFNQMPGPLETVAEFAKHHNKPLMIAESAPWKFSIQDAWDKWFVPMFDYVQRHDVAAICYINCNWDAVPMFHTEGWGDNRIQSSPELIKKWRAFTDVPRFIHSSNHLFD